MGRWVTSKGRRIYIPDEGEENPFAKKGEGKHDLKEEEKKIASMNTDERIEDLQAELNYISSKKSLTKADKYMQSAYTEELADLKHIKEQKRSTDYENKTVSENEAKKEKELAANKAQAEEEKYKKQYDSEWSKFYRESYLTKDSDEKLGELQKEMMKVIDREHKNPGSVNRQQLHMSFGVLNAINQERQQRKGGWKASVTPKDKRKKK